MPCSCWYLISLLIASSCSCSIKARVCASAWPPGDSRSTELKIVSRSSSRSEASMSLSNAWATFARTLACCMRSHSCSFKVCTWIKSANGEEMEEGYSDGEADKESRKKDIEEKNKTTKREIEWAATERQEVSLILEHWTLTHHTDTVISNTLTYMSLMSKAEANRKKWRKKIIRENSNIRLKQVKEGRMHTIQIVRNEEDNPKVKQNYFSRKGERDHLCSSTILHFSEHVETPFILIWKWSFCDLDIVILIIN